MCLKQKLATQNMYIFIISITIATVSLLSTTSNAQTTLLLPNYNLENVHVDENKPVGSIIHTVRAEDPKNRFHKFFYMLASTSHEFSIDTNTGEVKIQKTLDREQQQEYLVALSVFDATTRKLVENHQRTIYIDDVDDSYPVFALNKYFVNQLQPHNYYYNVNISELAPINSVVISDLEVSDNDFNINADMTIDCVAESSSENACEVFNIFKKGPSKSLNH